jgi:hypothetical protein
MRKALFTVALLASAFTLNLPAHADTIDDFMLTGGGETVTFSLPATGVYTLHEHFDSFSAMGPGIIVGAPATVTATFYIFDVPAPFPALGIASDPPSDIPSVLYGSITYSWFVVPPQFPNPSDEGTLNITFVPGTYQLSNTSTMGSSQPSPPPPLDFTLTITPETPTAPSPEPASLTLFGTGALGIISLATRRRTA